MAKAKNKRNNGLADKVHSKRKADVHKKKLNPFEVHINKEKIKVLGKKSKHDRGLPGVSRAKANKKRKETLGTEMKLMNKTNAFIDRRIGEKDSQLSTEDRIIARFAAERAKQHTKKNIYNLADDEILTHRGQTLEQIEKFDDPKSSDDEDDDGRKGFGGLNDEFVAEGHFGGGVLARSEQDGAKSHKDLIEQLIAESKKRKAEKQKEKEQTLDLTEKLDSEWKDLQPVVLKKARVEESLIEKVLSQAEKGADYDQMMRELRFEKRGTPSDALKNKEKQDEEEKKKLEQLEREREERMLGEEDGNTVRVTKAAIKHRSAEELDDNLELDEEPNFMLAYDKDGNPLVPDQIFQANNVPNGKKQYNDGISDSSSDDDDDDDDDNEENKDDDSGDDSDEEQTDTKKSELNEKESQIENEREDVDQDVKADDENPVLRYDDSGDESDKKASSDGDDSGSEQESTKKADFDNFNDLKGSDKDDDDVESDGDDEKMASLFDSEATEGYNLKELLSGKSAAQQATAIQKLIKSYDPSLAEQNKDLLTRLFAQLLLYINDIFTDLKFEQDVINSFQIFDKLAPHIYDLAQTNKVSTKKYLIEHLKEKHARFKKAQKKVPDLDTLILFKLVSLVYPTSDFRHPVTTPVLVFMSEILTLCRFRDIYSISRGIFVTTLILEYTTLSKRLVPSALNFLRGLLYLTASTSVLNPIQIVPPFRLHKDVKILILEHDCSKMAFANKMAAKDLVATEISDDFKIRCLESCVGLLKEFFDYFNDIEAQTFLFEPHIQLLSRVDLDVYPEKMAGRMAAVLKEMTQCLEVKTYTPLCRENKRIKALRMYEPDVQEVFTGGKNWKQSREKTEENKLKHKYKKVMKGALREIRRDKSYIASVKIRDRIHSDNIRKDKVKNIFKDASIQQGELNALKRKK